MDKLIEVALIACLAGCTSAGSGALAIDREGPGALVATLTVGGERVAIASQLTTVAGATGTDDQGAPLVEPDVAARVTTVTGEDGTVYASWLVPVDSGEVSGTMGGQAFGTVDTADTDMDPAYWQPVIDGRAGEVLEAVSDAAGALAGHDDVADELADLAGMRELLGNMGESPIVPAFSCQWGGYIGESTSKRSSSTCTDSSTAELEFNSACVPWQSVSHYVSIWNKSSRLGVEYTNDWLTVVKPVAKAATVYRRAHYGYNGHSFWGGLHAIGVPNDCAFETVWNEHP